MKGGKIKKALILMPFSIVKAFQQPLLAIAKILNEQKIELTVVHCRQAMKNGCNTMLAHKIGFNSPAKEKKEICNECYCASTSLAKWYPWKTVWLEEQDLQSRNHNQKLLSNSELKKISGYEVKLVEKTHSKLSKEGLREWKNRNTDLKNIMPQAWSILVTEKPDFILSFNTLYGIHQLFMKLSKKLKIPIFSAYEGYHANKNDEFIIQKNDNSLFLEEILKNRSINHINTKDIENIKHHISGIIHGTRPWHYSQKTIAEDKREPKKSRTKVLITLSSADEVVAANSLGILPKIKNKIFDNQIDWLKWVFRFAKKHPEALFYIRPHPRIYPNNREDILSPFARKLAKIRNEERPKNVIWPVQEEQGSLWQHLDDTDIMLNGWSSVSEVFGIYGIPTYCFFPKYSNSTGKTEKTFNYLRMYETDISRTIKNPKRKKNTKLILWLHKLLTHNTVQIQWSLPKWFRHIRRFIPAKKRESFDINIFNRFAQIHANVSKIINIIEYQIK
jgi:hypothetical protein